MSFYTQLAGFNGSLYLPLAGGSMSGSIAVDVDNSVDLGSSINNWRNLYVRGISSNSALAVDAAAVVSIGANSATGVAVGRAGINTQILGTLRYDNTAGSASSGGGSLPALARGYLVISVGGVAKKVPYYDN